MLRDTKRLGIVVVSLFLLGSCQKDHSLPSKIGDLSSKKNDNWSIPSYTQLRSSQVGAEDVRYLGESFNLLKYSQDDEDGFSDFKVLSLNHPAWSPFGRDIEEENFKTIINSKSPQAPTRKHSDDILSENTKDSIHFTGKASYKGFYLGYTKQELKSQSNKVHSFQDFTFYTKRVVQYDLKDPQRLEFYLSKRFVRDLQNISAQELITKYGTHIVTQYELGPYTNLIVSASSSEFASSEVRQMGAKLLDNLIDLSHNTKKKIERYSSHISIVYRQGGSSYIPESSLLSFGGFYKQGTVKAIDHKEWDEKIRPNDYPFIALRGDQTPIPDLISNIPLKVKYVAGILHQLPQLQDKAINYILCNPKTYEPFKWQDKFVKASLRSYANARTDLKLGLDNIELLTEGLLTGTTTPSSTYWDLSVKGGLWTIVNPKTSHYLCTDGKIRTEAEDVEGIRYWLLNPIIPTASGNSIQISRLLIQPNKQ